MERNDDEARAREARRDDARERRRRIGHASAAAAGGVAGGIATGALDGFDLAGNLTRAPDAEAEPDVPSLDVFDESANEGAGESLDLGGRLHSADLADDTEVAIDFGREDEGAALSDNADEARLDAAVDPGDVAAYTPIAATGGEGAFEQALETSDDLGLLDSVEDDSPAELLDDDFEDMA